MTSCLQPHFKDNAGKVLKRLKGAGSKHLSGFHNKMCSFSKSLCADLTPWHLTDISPLMRA